MSYVKEGVSMMSATPLGLCKSPRTRLSSVTQATTIAPLQRNSHPTSPRWKIQSFSIQLAPALGFQQSDFFKKRG